MIINKKLILKDFFSLKKPEYYCNNRNNKKKVEKTSDTVCEKSDCPRDNQDYCYDINYISHNCMFILFIFYVRNKIYPKQSFSKKKKEGVSKVNQCVIASKAKQSVTSNYQQITSVIPPS